ncbi:hypothetical protein RND71_032789 [Anisodus tanguticus]|uniref:Uncharacterized protein n=1 Tax=Anisodus tanguticus TaxID=243964 RepID=A0AAE1V3B9_9SOLA|nr:hypothetical protein RND71_032789 [Anisodus tanguticus]
MEPHVALLPSAGMGHLMPFLRLAAMLASRNCKFTLLTVQPTVSAAESNHLNSFFTAHPHIQRLDFHVLPLHSSNPHDDPFFLQFEAIIRSVHLLPPLLSSLYPPISALFLDIAAATCVDQLADDPSLSISYYILSTTSARFFSLLTHLPHLTLEGSCKNLQLPGLPSFSRLNIPPPLFNPENLFTTQLISNARAISKSKRELKRRQGMVVKEWVNQEEILAHPAIGGFFSHCGWNSVMEAAQRGVPMLAWTLNGDQRFNAEVVEKAGLG